MCIATWFNVRQAGRQRQAGEPAAPLRHTTALLHTNTVYLGFFGDAMVDLVNCERKSIGTGKMIVEFFSAAMELRVCGKE